MIERDLERIKNINEIHKCIRKIVKCFEDIARLLDGDCCANMLGVNATASDRCVTNLIYDLTELLEFNTKEIEDMKYKVYIEFLINCAHNSVIGNEYTTIAFWMVDSDKSFEEFIESVILKCDKDGIYYDKLKEIHSYASGDIDMYCKLCEKEFGNKKGE